MKCTQEYLKRLIELAEDLKKTQDGLFINKYDLMRSKTNYLIGYILASKELLTKDKK